MTELDAQIAYYKSQHTTLGCKITHLIGVPLIALSVPLILFNPRRALHFFAVGWVFQFIGHLVFEKNQPVLVSEHRNPLVILAALIYVTDGWMRVFSGRPLIENNSQDQVLAIEAHDNGRRSL